MLKILETVPARLEENILLAAFAALYPNWTTSASLLAFYKEQLGREFSAQQLRMALQRGTRDCLIERRTSVDPALKVDNPRRGRIVVLEHRMTAAGVTIFNRRERERAIILGYDPVFIALADDEAG